jgi:hypothetical protein
VHYSRAGDSITRTYFYDSEGRLTKLEDQKLFIIQMVISPMLSAFNTAVQDN